MTTVCERERESLFVRVCELERLRERESRCVFVCVREIKRKTERKKERKKIGEFLHVCVCVHECMCLNECVFVCL